MLDPSLLECTKLYVYIRDKINHTHSPVENQNGRELGFKFFSWLILVVQALYFINPTDAKRFEIFKMASKMAAS